MKTAGSSTGFFSRLKSILTPRGRSQRSEESTRPFIPIDAAVDLPYDKPIAELNPGDLFGEMTCMSYYPRSATVRAKTDCVMLEMLRNVLDILQRTRRSAPSSNRKYRARALDTHLAASRSSRDHEEFIDHLRDRVELIRYSPGEVIVRQGDAADASTWCASGS